jgi:formylglycine-generating enzyme required for sulfatase activity
MTRTRIQSLAITIICSLFLLGLFAVTFSSCGGGEEVTEDDDSLDTGLSDDIFGTEERLTSFGGFEYEFFSVFNSKIVEIPAKTYMIGSPEITYPDRFPRHPVQLQSYVFLNSTIAISAFHKFIQVVDPYHNREKTFELDLKVKDYEAILASVDADWLTYEKKGEKLVITMDIWTDEGWNFIQSNNIIAPLDWPEPKERSREYDTFIDQNKEYPVRGISYYEALACSRAFGVRLPTEEEYEAAAGGGDRLYPWGDQLDVARDPWNDRGPSFAGAQPRELRARVEGNKEISDVAASLQQWTASDYKLYYDPNDLQGSIPSDIYRGLSEEEKQTLIEYAQNNDKLNKGYKVTRGSSYVDIDYNKTVYYRLPLPKETRDERVGFRPCHSNLEYVTGIWVQEEGDDAGGF